MSDKKVFSRRSFLSSLTAIMGSASMLAVTSPGIEAAPKNHAADEDQPLPVAKGYQRTPHVDTYYSLADL
jgi:hypothetical protein